MTLPSSNQMSDLVMGFGFVACVPDVLRRFVGGVGSVAGTRTLGVKYEGILLQRSTEGSRDKRVKSRVRDHASRLYSTCNTTTTDNDDHDDHDGTTSSAGLGAS